MRSLKRAEAILSLATTPERAQAIAGDLFEAKGSRLWLSVLTTAAALAMRGLSFRLTGIVLRGFLWQFLYQLATLVPLLGLAAILRQFYAPDVLEPFFYAGIGLALIFTQYRVGKVVLAKRSEGRQLSAWLGLAILNTILNSAYIEWRSGTSLSSLAVMLTCFLLWEAPVLAGVIRRETRP